MDPLILTKTYICKGSILSTPLGSILNPASTSVADVYVQVYKPNGVIFHDAQLPVGYYNADTNQWKIGTMEAKKQLKAANFEWEVTDDCYAPFTFTFVVKGGPCVNSSDEVCVKIDGPTQCQINLRKPVFEVFYDYTVDLRDDTILINASIGDIEITLPDPDLAYIVNQSNPNKSGGSQFEFIITDLTNSVTIKTPDGKIVSYSTLADATDEVSATLVGQTFSFIAFDGNYYTKISI